MKKSFGIMDSQMMEQVTADEMTIICKNCGNIYRNIWLKMGDDWNDFGLRYCPFCGTETEEFAHIS